MRLESFVSGKWVSGTKDWRPLVNPVTGAAIAEASAAGVDVAAGMEFARQKGGAALRALTFGERADLLKSIADVLVANRARYEEIARENSGNTKADASIDIDGGIGTLKFYAKLGQGLGSARQLMEESQDQLAREPVFFAGHIWTTRPGLAVQINAFNFPSWGLWEKVAAALLAGVPSLIKPATATALLSHEMIRDVVNADILPEGALTLVCGSGEALLDHLEPMDSVAFTGSAATGARIRAHQRIQTRNPRVNIEADSVNATILGPDAAPGTLVFDLAVREAVKALSVKAGQLCTNIRRIFVHHAHERAFTEAVAGKVSALHVGDPCNEAVRVGPLINMAQRKEAETKIAHLLGEAETIAVAPLQDHSDLSGFVAPTLLRCAQASSAHLVHEIEVFGPCATVLPYSGLDQAVALSGAAGGALVLSLFSNDVEVQRKALTDAAAWHGRVLCVDDEVGKAHTGHAIVMPQCVHGGPGRAGGGEELGGLRALRYHMQRSAVQGGAALLDRLRSSTETAAL